jgi:isoleucyl-tRNA synthetase
VQFSIDKVSEVGYGALQLLQGRKVYYVPGWDCHGLPIELKGKDLTQISPLT